LQNVTHFEACANQFRKSAHQDANHLFAVCPLYTHYFVLAAKVTYTAKTD